MTGVYRPLATVGILKTTSLLNASNKTMQKPFGGGGAGLRAFVRGREGKKARAIPSKRNLARDCTQDALAYTLRTGV